MKLTYTSMGPGRYVCDQDRDITVVRYDSDDQWRVKHQGRSIVRGTFLTKRKAVEAAQQFYDAREAARNLGERTRRPAEVPPAATLRAAVEHYLREMTETILASLPVESEPAPEPDLPDLAIAEAELRERILRRVRYDVLREIDEQIDGWIVGSKQNWEDCNSGRPTHPGPWLCEEDFRRILADTARGFGIADQWSTYQAGRADR